MAVLSMSRLMAWALILGLLCFTSALAEDPWGDVVLDYSPVEPVNAGFDTPLKSLGEPVGGGTFSQGNSSLVSLGVPGGSITIKFDTPVTDDAANPMGLDCIVFGNSTWAGNDPLRKWQEPAVIEISEDVNGNGLADDAWYLIPGSEGYTYTPFPTRVEAAGDSNDGSPYGFMGGIIVNPNSTDGDGANDDDEYYWGYAELTPTVEKYLDNYLRPDDPTAVGLNVESGGGDAFDIAWAVDASGDPAGLTQFHFIRLTALVSRTFTTYGYCTPEVDAVADVAPEVDTDGDGILDEYETRVADTDPLRAESTVLPLEVPIHLGGADDGDLLGTAEDSVGNSLSLYAGSLRINSYRQRNATVDVVRIDSATAADPDGGLVRSVTALDIICSESDFAVAEVQHGEVIFAYESADIDGLEEANIMPYRYADGTYTQDGISEVLPDTLAGTVRFRTRYPGRFFLLSTLTGETGPVEVAAPLHFHWPSIDDSDPARASLAAVELRTTEGDIVPDGTVVTVEIDNGTIETADADPVLAGHQLAIIDGALRFQVKATQLDDEVAVTFYADAAKSTLIDTYWFTAAEWQSVPVGGTPVLIVLIILSFYFVMRRRRAA